MNIRQLIAPQTLCNIVQAPPELIAGSQKSRLRRLLHTILLVCRLVDIGHNAVLIKKYPAKLVALIIKTAHRLNMKVKPVSVGKLNEPAIRL